jgi:hypothetical protein
MTVSGASAAYRPISPGFQPNDEEGASRLQEQLHGATLFGVLFARGAHATSGMDCERK